MGMQIGHEARRFHTFETFPRDHSRTGDAGCCCETNYHLVELAHERGSLPQLVGNKQHSRLDSKRSLRNDGSAQRSDPSEMSKTSSSPYAVTRGTP